MNPIEELGQKWETEAFRLEANLYANPGSTSKGLRMAASDLHSLPPLIPAPQWMPEGWVPSEEGVYYFVYKNDYGWIVRLCEVMEAYGDLVAYPAEDNDSVDSVEFHEYRWCPLPASPKMEG